MRPPYSFQNPVQRTPRRHGSRWAVPFAALALAATTAHAASPSSANYGIVSDTVDTGGAPAVSAAYAGVGSVGTAGGLSSATAAAQITVKGGYLGQLFEITGLQLAADLAVIPEAAARQLRAALTLDDATTLSLALPSVSWAAVSGPVASVLPGGLLTAGTVYQDTPAQVAATYGGTVWPLALTIQNVNPDDFGTYAADGLPDDWQVQYFGIGNLQAAPGADASGTGQTNLFKYTAGLNPTDPSAVFVLAIQPVPGEPAQKKIAFAPIVAGRSYAVEFTTDLAAGPWLPLAGTAPLDLGQVRSLLDPAATEPVKFYRVLVTKP